MKLSAGMSWDVSINFANLKSQILQMGSLHPRNPHLLCHLPWDCQLPAQVRALPWSLHSARPQFGQTPNSLLKHVRFIPACRTTEDRQAQQSADATIQLRLQFSTFLSWEPHRGRLAHMWGRLTFTSSPANSTGHPKGVLSHLVPQHRQEPK